VVGAVAAVGLGTVKLSMMNMASWSEITFRFEPTPQILAGSIVFAGVMGIFGGFLPAVRAARTSPVQAMRG
jgi:putative ABC transport system permease protein